MLHTIFIVEPGTKGRNYSLRFQSGELLFIFHPLPFFVLFGTFEGDGDDLAVMNIDVVRGQEAQQFAFFLYR